MAETGAVRWGTLTPSSRRRCRVILVIFFAVAVPFVFLFFLVWLLSKEEIASHRPIRRA